jgi:hypothetical protein
MGCSEENTACDCEEVVPSLITTRRVRLKLEASMGGETGMPKVM